MDLPLDPAILLLGIYLKESKTLIQEYISTPGFIEVLLIMAKISVDEWIKQLWDIYTMEFYSAIKKKKYYPSQQYGWTWRALC